MTTSVPDLAPICAQFPFAGRFVAGVPHGSGHINDTYAVTFDQGGSSTRYILQRINHRIFRDVPRLMENIARVSAHVTAQVRSAPPGNPPQQALTLVPTRSGENYYREPNGAFWRAYVFVEHASTHDLVTSPKLAREAAFSFGNFQRQLANLAGPRLHETIPNFHHTRQRFLAFERALAADPRGRAASVKAEVDFARKRESLVDLLLNLHAAGDVAERVTHNDTKTNNVMIDDATGVGICVIDLDTVMPGLSLYDFGDMVRSATNAAAEDERDLTRVESQLRIFDALVSGYLAATRTLLNPIEIDHLATAGRLMTFEVGLRFLTDYLEGDVYFKIKRPDHNLDRCRNQFALVASMEKQKDAMEGIVRQHRLS
ncbi:MAG TPA: aminoglycoside phosphotransferase family protein [Opitutaceae bacterium]|nr:aminoglycoside phosphotransferase family protein [Opitutaceae bacterium]